MWGRGRRGNNATCLALWQFSVTSSETHKQIVPFSCWFPGGWVCVHSRTLWVSPTNSPMRLGVSHATSTPTGFFSQRFWGFISPHWNPGLCGLSHSPVVPPGLSAHKCGTTCPASHCLTWSASHHLAASPLCPAACLCPSYGLDECFFFNSLVIRLPYSSIFCQFWLFFVLKFVVVLLLVVRGGTVYLPMPPSWPEVQKLFNLI